MPDPEATEIDGEDHVEEPPNKKSQTEVPAPEATEIDGEDQVEEPPKKKRKHTKPPEKVAEGEGVERSGADGEGKGVTFVECSLGLLKTTYCDRCKNEVNPLKATHKTKTKVYCWKCGNKGVKLSRIYGTWPPSEFRDLSAKEQTEFWKSHADSDEALETLVSQTLCKKMLEQEEDKHSGDFQPLTYWQNLGYDVDRIVKNTPDHMKEYHVQLGWTYKVSIHTKSTSKIEKRVRDHLLQVKHDAQRTRGVKGRPSFLHPEKGAGSVQDAGSVKTEGQREAIDICNKVISKGTESEGKDEGIKSEGKDKDKGKDKEKKHKKEKKIKKESTSSDSSSSDADAKERKKKAKEEKKRKKEAAIQAALERARVKEEKAEKNKKDKKTRTNHAICNKVISKSSAVHVSLERDLLDDILDNVPSAVVLPAKKSYDEVVALMAKAKKNLATQEPSPWPEGFVDGFPDQVSKWMDSANLLSAQLAAIKRLSAA